MPKLIIILLAGCASCALFMTMHAGWRRIFGQPPRPPWSYVAGVLGLALPFSVVMVLWGDWWAIYTAIAVVVGGGGAVLYGYKVRGLGPVNPEGLDSEAIIQMLRARNRELEEKLMVLEGRGECQEGKGNTRPKG